MYTVERNSCSCHPETCSHWNWYLFDPEGHRTNGSDDHEFLSILCKDKNMQITQLANKQKEVTMSEQSNVLTHVEKILNADKSASIGFDDNKICHLTIKGVEFDLYDIDDEKLGDVLDAIVLLTKHNLVG